MRNIDSARNEWDNMMIEETQGDYPTFEEYHESEMRAAESQMEYERCVEIEERVSENK